MIVPHIFMNPIKPTLNMFRGAKYPFKQGLGAGIHQVKWTRRAGGGNNALLLSAGLSEYVALRFALIGASVTFQHRVNVFFKAVLGQGTVFLRTWSMCVETASN